jgi:hypothetical protein
VRLDPRTHAVRGDLADVRLADRVFAPHYAAPIECLVARGTPLLAKPDGGETAIDLHAGETFEMLELTGAYAWGIAPASGLVGYCDRAALELA